MSTSKLWQNAQAQFESLWTGKTQYCYRFEDTREAMGTSGSRRVFTKARPSDYLVTDGGVTFFAEIKSSQHPTSFNLNNIEKEQWHSAIRVTVAGGLYFFFIRRELSKQWYRVPAAIMINTIKNKKSIKWIDLEFYEWEPKCSVPM